MKTSNVNRRSSLVEKTFPGTLTLKKPLGMLQELKIKSLVKEPFQDRNPSSLNRPNIKHPQQDRFQEALELLRDLYPKSFNRESPKPLKIGIDKDIIKKGFWPYSVRFLRRVLSFYANSKKYQQSLLKESYRYSLEGNPAGFILDYHKNRAHGKLQRILQRQKQQENSLSKIFRATQTL